MKRIKKLRGTNISRLDTILSWSSVSIFNYICYDGYVDELFEITSIFIFLYFNYASNPSDYSTFYEGLIDLPCYKIISDQLFYTVMLAVFQFVIWSPNKFLLKNLYTKSAMPPKKNNQKSKSEPKQLQQEKKEKQTKLFSKQIAQDKPIVKSRSKQFNEGPDVLHGKSNESDWQYGTGKTPDKLFISSWNVNGIRSVLNKKDLESYLEKSKPDIICVNQTKIGQQGWKKGAIKIDGYHGYWNFCKASEGYSGVAIFSKYLPISVKQDLPQPEHSHQGRVLTMEFQKFYLITAYVPNSGQKLDRLTYRVQNWDKCLQDYVEELRKKKTTIICGDLNVCHQQIDIARPKGNQKTAGFTVEERQSFTKFLENGWVDTFRHFYPKEVKYSWWSMRTGGRSKNIGWRLDYFVINKEALQMVKDSLINNNVFGSDHCPVEMHLLLK